MEKKKPDLKFYTINNINDSTLTELNKTFFPSLTHKELMSLHDLKLKTNFDIRNKKNKNFNRNFHSEIMKNNLKEYSKYSTLYKDSSTYTNTETKFPSLQKGKNETIVKLYMDTNTINSLINKSVNKNIKINNKNIFNNNISKKYNVSNLSTSGNASPSIKSFKYSVLDKIKSNSVDFNGSLLNLEKEENSIERQIIPQQKSYNNSSLSFPNPIKYINTETINNKPINLKNEFNKKFVSSLNPLYASFKKDVLSEFHKKNKDINYLKFIIMKNKKDIEIEQEKRISSIERADQILFSIKTLQSLFDNYFYAKYDYLNYLKKEINDENEKNEVLKEEKMTLTKEIFTIRHKTQRLENRFKNYLDDKFFLLSVKNHSFKLDKFDPIDKADYKKDLQKLEILNLMLKITSKDFDDNQIDKDLLRASKFLKPQDILKMNLNIPSSNNNKVFQRSNIKKLSSKKTMNMNNLNYSPLLSVSKKNILSRNAESKPIYEDVYYFNKDLQETTKKIQDSLDEYNNTSKELNLLKQNLIKTKKEMNEIREYETHLKKEIVLFNKNLDNLKQLNNGLVNYKKYLQHIFILNLNKGKVFDKINCIINNIENSKDNNLIDFITREFNEYNTYLVTGLDKLKLIEKILEYLITFKEKQKNEKNEKYYEIKHKIDFNNRKKIHRRKQFNIKNKFNLLIQNVIDKNKKIIFLKRKEAQKNMKLYLQKNKSIKKEKEDDDYFGDFDFF